MPPSGRAQRPWWWTLVRDADDKHAYTFWLVSGLVVVLWFLTLGTRHLLPSDEGRYAEMAREMLVSGDWVTPRYNGLKYFEKPPFQLWMTALAFKAFGVGEWQARLWVAMSGAAGVIATALMARRWFGSRVALYAVLVLVASPAWNLGSHFNSLDMGVSAALAFVLAGILLSQHPDVTDSERRRWLWVAWAAMGVAVLTKGLIGIVLPLLALIGYAVAARDWSLWRRLEIARGVALVIVVTAPWFVLVSQRNSDFATFFFIHEHFQRFTTTVHHRGGGWWYFIPVALVGFLPWLPALGRGVRAPESTSADRVFRPILWLVVWAATVFVFFSFSGSKLPGYIIPMFPALAVVAALALASATLTRWRIQLGCAAAFFVCALVASPWIARLGSSSTPNAQYRAYAPWVVGAASLGLVGTVWAWGSAGRSMRRSVVVYAITFFLVETILLQGHERFGRSSSGVDLVGPIEAAAGRDTPLYFVRLLDHTLPFYLRRTATMVEDPGELEFGTRQEPDKWLPTIEAFEARWKSGAPALAVMTPATYRSLRDRQLDMTYVVADARRVVVTNRGARQ